MIEVVNAIAYRGTPSVAPESNERIWELEVGANWNVRSPNVIKFVQESNKKIDPGAKEYTTFKNNPSNHEFPTLLQQYLNGDCSFQHFHSTFSDKRLKQYLKNSRLEEGAVIVFVHFKISRDPEIIVLDDGTEQVQNPEQELEVTRDQFSVLMVRNTGALKFTEDLQISETDVIDLKQFVQGCQVDLLRFSSGEEAENHSNFLSFVTGTGEVREYFKEALFAEVSITNKASSQNVEKALNDFWNEHRDEIGSRAVRDQINSSVYMFSEEHKKQVVTLEQISNVVDQCLPLENADLRGTFATFANEGPYEINDEFELNANIIKELVYVDLDVGFAKFSLEKRSIGLVGDTDDYKFRFDAATGEITMTTTIEDPVQLRKINSILENE